MDGQPAEGCGAELGKRSMSGDRGFETFMMLSFQVGGDWKVRPVLRIRYGSSWFSVISSQFLACWFSSRNKKPNKVVDRSERGSLRCARSLRWLLFAALSGDGNDARLQS